MRDLRVEQDGVTLVGSYTPAGDTAIVALHSAGEGTRADCFLYGHLHDVLPPVGIGVVTFDRRGEGESTGDASRGRFSVQVKDALAVREAIDVERVGLWGYSQGAWIGPLAAAVSERIAFLVLIASTGVTPSEQMMYATAQQLRPTRSRSSRFRTPSTTSGFLMAPSRRSTSGPSWSGWRTTALAGVSCPASVSPVDRVPREDCCSKQPEQRLRRPLASQPPSDMPTRQRRVVYR